GYASIPDPYPLPSVKEGSVGAKRRDEAWDTLSPLLAHHLSLFVKNERNRLIKEALASTGTTRQYIIRQLRRYWQRGMAPNALVPDYHKCGNPDGKWKTRLVQNEQFHQELAFL
ncbi:MAG: hypothetical protein ABJF18_06495, partial [Marinobacter alexandrii]